MARQELRKGQVVWAKLTGHSWWPGVIDSLSRTKKKPQLLYTIKFIGENTYAELGPNRVISFEEGFDDFSQIKGKRLQVCIKHAQQLASGKLPISQLWIINKQINSLRKHPPPAVPVNPQKNKPKQSQTPRRSVSRAEDRKGSKQQQPTKRNRSLSEPSKSPPKRPKIAQPRSSNVQALTFTTPPARRDIFDDIKQPDDDRPPSGKLISHHSLPYLLQGSDSVLVAPTEVTLAAVGRELKHAQLVVVQAWLQRLERVKDFLMPGSAVKTVLKTLAGALRKQPECKKLGRLAERLHLSCKLAHVDSALRSAAKISSHHVEEHISSSSESEAFSVSPKPAPMLEEKIVQTEACDITLEKCEKEEVANPQLRGNVCRKIFSILSTNGFAEAESQHLALQIEGGLRAQDPSMTEKYHRLYKRMVKDIQKVRPAVLENLS